MTLRQCIAALLLAVFGLPVLVSAMAMGQDPESALPACCRRNGAHHCMMTMGERARLFAPAENEAPRFRAPQVCCPYCPAAPVSVHTDPLSTPVEVQITLLPFGSQSGVVAQTESRWRIARDRSRQKRGPPASAHS